MGQMQFPLPSIVQFSLQFPVQFPLTWQEPPSPTRQEMPEEFRTSANPARSRTSVTIGNLFIVYPLRDLNPCPTRQDRVLLLLFIIHRAIFQRQAAMMAVSDLRSTLLCKKTQLETFLQLRAVASTQLFIGSETICCSRSLFAHMRRNIR